MQVWPKIHKLIFLGNIYSDKLKFFIVYFFHFLKIYYLSIVRVISNLLFYCVFDTSLQIVN